MGNLNKPIFFITDRRLTLSDSIARYLIDVAEGFNFFGQKAVICSTEEVKREDYSLPNEVEYLSELPSLSTKGIWHFHLTFSIREHTRFFLKNIQKLKGKTIVTLHVTPEYALKMGQEKEMKLILGTILKHSVKVLVFSNYAKCELKKYGLKKVWVVYPGLNLRRYSKYLKQIKNKKRQILVVASNPDALFVNKIKGFLLVKNLEKRLKNYHFEKVVNLPFEEYLKKMAESEYYLALSSVEHYGFAIIDAYNLFTLPLYVNEGGLTEAVDGHGFPIVIEDNHRFLLPKAFKYDNLMVKNNFDFAKIQYSLERHLESLKMAYSLLL